MKTRKNWAGFAVGLMCGAVIFGGAGYAAGVVATPLSETSQKVTLDGQEVSLEGYNINGNSYFKLRDVGKAVDFGVTWDNATRTVQIDTNSGYVEEQKPSVPGAVSIPSDPTGPTNVKELDESSLVNGIDITEVDVYKLIVSLKNEYPQGMRWTDDDYYQSTALCRGGHGCEGFALICSDIAFGNLPISRTHSNFDEIRVGDMIRMNNDTHTVIVLQKKKDSVIIVEGNFNNSINWGREVKRQTLENGNFVVRTRYPN